MSEEQVFRIVVRLVAEVCDRAPDAVRADAKLRAQGLDSMRAVELVVLLEDALRIKLPADAMERNRAATVAEFAKYVFEITQGGAG